MRLQVSPSHFNIVQLAMKLRIIDDFVTGILNDFPKPFSLSEEVRFFR
jgi:hypothetical protein